MKYSILKLITDKEYRLRDLEKLRGFLIQKYEGNTIFHNHVSGNFDYSYPKLQYKLIKRNLAIMAIEEVCDLNSKMFEEIEYIDIFGDMFFDIKKELEIKNEDIVYSKDEMFDYKFVSPYLPLNQKNFRKFLDGEYDLNKAITNNILEVMKGLGIWLKPDEKIYVSQDLKINKRELKDVSMVTFDGKFSINIKFPDYFSIGKRKSIGYGTFVIDKAK